jgi:SAM-dependent methyltransferase
MEKRSTPGKPYEEAARGLLEEFSWNPWFLSSYWPENAPRVGAIAALASGALSASSISGAPRLLEVGCANGYIAYLFSLMGFDTSAVDTIEDEKRDEMFRKGNISYTSSNLNAARPLAELPDASFDVIVLGEVFEHILNHPAGLLKAVLRLLRPNGLVVLTTPNPSTLANAFRLLNDRYVLWGTPDFLRDIKLDQGNVTDRGDIHYHEYPAWIVRDLMVEAGYRIENVMYYNSGIAPAHSLIKRVAKHLLRLSGLSQRRLFAFGYIIAARKPT